MKSVDKTGLPALWRRYRGLPRNVFAIGLVSLLNDASSEIIYPLLPIFLGYDDNNIINTPWKTHMTT